METSKCISKCISKSVSLPEVLWKKAADQAWTERKSLSKLVAEAVETCLKAKSERRTSND